MKSNLEKIGVIFIGLSGLFSIHSVTIMSFFLILTLIILFITIDKQKLKKIKNNRFFIPFLLLFIYLLIQIFLSKNKMVAVNYTKGWWTIIYLFIIPLFVNDRKKRNLILFFYIIGAILGIVWGFYKYFTYYINSIYRLRGFGVGILPFALFMGFGLLCFVYFFIKKKKYLFLIPITLSSLVINFSRSIGPFLSLFPAISVFILGKDKKERFFQIFLCFIILILSFFSVEKTIVKGVSYTEPEKITNATARKLYWRYSLYCFKKSPILGVKTGDFWTYTDDFISNNILTEWEIKHIQRALNTKFHAHNFYIDTLGRTGIIGFTLILIFIVTFFYEILRYYKKDNERSILLLSSLVYILFYSFTEDPFFKSDMAFPLYYIFCSNTGYDNN